ncbi:hypothetical protein COLO4_35444 [Corchorus olitorius]|uniref:Uncharacterized protein n=1 Tax=Corchorus olitorius TaxID=93759 RepID=A0A1R3GGW6_9ROSI|nr:hypothetical protein COLO4_35444 [Corchorus olitorius]
MVGPRRLRLGRTLFLASEGCSSLTSHLGL